MLTSPEHLISPTLFVFFPFPVRGLYSAVTLVPVTRNAPAFPGMCILVRQLGYFTKDLPENGAAVSGALQATYFLYFRPVRSSPFSSLNCLSGSLSYSPSISFL